MADVAIGSEFAGHRIDGIAGCGDISLRYSNADFGGPTECERRVKTGRIPDAFKTAETVEDTGVTGETATATLDHGATLTLVKGRSFWEIDGIA